MSFQLSDYHYHLPEGLIAQVPAEPRGSSRMLVLDRKQQTWQHRMFRDLPEFLSPSDLMVVNNSKVMRARLLGNRLMPDGVGGKIEFVLLEEVEPLVWEGLFRSTGKAVPGFRFEIPLAGGGAPIRGEILRGALQSPSGCVLARLDRDPIAARAGHVPLPPYIHSEHTEAANEQAEQHYQTVFAKNLGSAAAPTAGLHFTQAMMSALQNKGITREEVTLHVGVGTFRPVKVADVREHVMHEERYVISSDTAERITLAKQNSHQVLAVGTTAVRTLESAWDMSRGALQSGSGRSSLFLHPGESGSADPTQFRVVDRMLTNFHLPESTLLMLVSAFAGRSLVLAAYQDAIKEKYRFFSYGDAMLIL